MRGTRQNFILASYRMNQFQDHKNQSVISIRVLISLMSTNLIFVNSYLLCKLITVRIHANLRYELGSYVDLWYLLKALDIQGTGRFEIEVDVLAHLTSRKVSTIYEQLREGRSKGLFRSYSIKKGVLYGYLGGLIPVYIANDLYGWDAITTIPAINIQSSIKLGLVRSVTSYQQTGSRNAIARKFDNRQIAGAYFNPLDTLIREQKSFTSPVNVHWGKKAFLGICKRYLYSTKSLLSFGATLNSTAKKLKISTRTIQRWHQGIEKRQIATNRKEFEAIAHAMDRDVIAIGQTLCLSSEVFITRTNEKTYKLTEIYLGTGYKRESTVCRGNFFKGLFDRWYCSKTNIYLDSTLPKLENMRAKKRELNYQRYLLDSTRSADSSLVSQSYVNKLEQKTGKNIGRMHKVNLLKKKIAGGI